MRRYPGYTLGSLGTEDAMSLHHHLELLDPDLGEAKD